MSGFIETQKANNLETRINYDRYASLRVKSTELILAQQKTSKILIIGTGNCNDIDLIRLSNCFTEVHLIDIDNEAVLSGIEKQLGNMDTNIFPHIIDVTQIADQYEKLMKNPFSSRIKRIIEAVQSLSFPSLPNLKGTFDIVVSQCLISQLVYPIQILHSKEINKQTKRLLDSLAFEIVVAHLKEMAAYLAKNGVGIVTTDVVSSKHIVGMSNDNLIEILRECYFDNNSPNFGHNIFGTNISKIYSDYKKDLGPIINLVAKRPLDAPCWKWHFSEDRQYIVQGFVFQLAVNSPLLIDPAE